MSQLAHTYGPTCHLAKSVTFSGSKSDDDTPDLKAQFFYCSPLPIDDPLSAAPTPTGSDFKSVHPPRPFCAYDNNSLEEVWLGFGSVKDRKIHDKGKLRKPIRPSQNERPGSTVKTLASAAKQKTPSAEESMKPPPDTNAPAAQILNQPPPKAAKNAKISPFSADAANDGPASHTKKSGKTKRTEYAPSTSDNDAKHVLLLMPPSVCCSDFEEASDAPSKAHESTSGTGEQAVQAQSKKHKLLKDKMKEKSKAKHEKPASPSRDLSPPPGCCSDFEENGDAKSKSLESTNGTGEQPVPIESKKHKPPKENSKVKHPDSASASRDAGPPPECCSDLEMNSDAKSKPQESELMPTDGKKRKAPKVSSKRKHAKSGSASHELDHCQGDATDETFLTKVACSFKECESAKEPAEEPAQCDRGSKEHAALEKRENSKSHQDFEKHLQFKHPTSSEMNTTPPLQDKKPGGQNSEFTDKKPKSEKKPTPGPPAKKPDVQTSVSTERKPWWPKSSEKSIALDPEAKKTDGPPSEPADKKPKSSENNATPNIQVKKADSQGSEVSARKQKSSDKGAIPSPNSQPSDLTNRPEQGNDAGTTGLPFLKLPSRPTTPQPPVSSKVSHEGENMGLPDDHCADDGCLKRAERDSTETESLPDHKCKAHKNTKEHADVPVGVARLHKVILPALQMEPIYWSPVHDVAPVTRGTWFYKDTMLPVEPPVANQLETGYRDLRPWSQTWKDELHSAIDAGAIGEEKVAHQLWPRDEDKRNTSDDILATDPYCAARCFHGEAAAEGAVDSDGSAKKSPDTNIIVKKYPNAQIIYKDSKNAYILKPNLHPSAYHKRRPLQKIKKGLTIGVHVVRGFDWRAWENLHPSKKTTLATKVDEHAGISGDSNLGKRNTCVACRSQEERKECTDLVLVCHGIGQKLSESVESFNFTHAVNSFRRYVNVELSNEGVQKILRKDFGGVMVLPVNWRSNLSFDDGDTMKDGEHDRSGSGFSMNDITPDGIPAVRKLICDVMLDIPYYMSNNKPRMIQAVTTEANRVYRLWCKNNPNFQKNGRVHMIAHSLGSVMAVEILSNQPTFVPKIDFNGRKINTKHFDFNTTNLICAGSPAGFFLLLDKATLKPRYAHDKPGAEPGDDKDRSIVGNAGMFGCLAVDNIYNVMHQNDPIAYRLNPCADAQYAASLKTAYVPSATTTFFESIGNAMKSMTPGVSAPADLAVGQMAKPTLIARLPSQMEMDVHDFTAEEKAEKKFCLLNDNGQADYCLRSGGGPLEIQYINMIGAHSSYWTNPDFIRMIVTEVGRKAGRSNCLPNMKAVKIRSKS